MWPRSLFSLLFGAVFLAQCQWSSAWTSPSKPAVSSSRWNRLERGVVSPLDVMSRTHHWDVSSWSTTTTLRSTSVDLETSNVALMEREKDKQTPAETPSDGLQLEFKDKVINGVFLSMAFGYALYTIFSIDQGLTRGWTTSEIAMRIPLDNWGAYESYLANKPVVTKTLINVIIYLLGDWLSQTAFQGKNVLEFDIKRTLRNGFIGLCFGPLVHEYYQFSDSILPPEEGIVVRLQKILMDQTIYLTVKCSIYISAVGLLSGDDWPTVKQTVKDKIVGIVFTAWKFWPLVHCITYGLIPARHRILWVNSVDLVWNAILATKAQKTSPTEDNTAIDVLAVAADTEELTFEAAAHDSQRNETFFFNQESLVVEINPSAGDSPHTNSTSAALLV